jgi:hypothetical protein
MKKYCLDCNVELELCIAGDDVWTTDHMACPICNGTYEIFVLEKCKCKYAHKDGICRWPTLEGRLNQPLTSEKEALEQLQKTMPLSEYAKKRLKQLCNASATPKDI